MNRSWVCVPILPGIVSRWSLCLCVCSWVGGVCVCRWVGGGVSVDSF